MADSVSSYKRSNSVSIFRKWCIHTIVMSKQVNVLLNIAYKFILFNDVLKLLPEIPLSCIFTKCVFLRGEPHIGFRTQSDIVTLEGGAGAVTDEALKFRKIIEFESSWIVMNCQWRNCQKDDLTEVRLNIYCF